MTTYDPIERVRKARRQAASAAGVVVVACALLSLVAWRVWAGRSSGAPDQAAPAAFVDDGGPDLRWWPFRPGQDLPVSASAGPSRQVDGRVAGFARTQLGAALATIHISSRIWDLAVGPDVFGPTIDQQVVGADAGELARQVADNYGQARQQQGKNIGERLDPGPARLAAYQINRYSPDNATVSVIYAKDETASAYSSFRFDVRWTDGDWHLVSPPAGNLASVYTQLPALPVGAIALLRGS